MTGPRVVRILGQLAALGLLRVDRSAERWRWSQDDELHRYARELLAERRRGGAGVRPAGDRRSRGPAGGRRGQHRAGTPTRSPTCSARCARSWAPRSTGRADGATGLELAFRLHRYWAATSVGEGRFWLGSPAGGRRHEPATRAGRRTRRTPSATWSTGPATATRRSRACDGPPTCSPASTTSTSPARWSSSPGCSTTPTTPARRWPRSGARSTSPTAFGPELRMPTLMGLGSLLSERGDPEAAEHARRAIEVCRASGDADQLRMALPTAAMICWQVGADEEARAYVDEAMPMHDAGPRIAKVVLYSAAAGLALADGRRRPRPRSWPRRRTPTAPSSASSASCPWSGRSRRGRCSSSGTWRRPPTGRRRRWRRP